MVCSQRLIVEDMSAADESIWFPFDPDDGYKTFTANFTNFTVAQGTIFIRPFYVGRTDTTEYHIISSDSTMVSWSTEMPLRSVRLWSTTSDNWVDVYAR